MSALPEGAEQLAWLARQKRLTFEPRPNEDWFHAWEPFDTMVSAEHYVNAVSWSMPPGTVTAAEPWLADIAGEPIDRTLLVFVSHPAFTRRAAARAGEHFNTRVAYLESPPPPTVRIGDATWDAQVTTLAASASEAVAALPPGARRLLLSWRFTGHLEVRPGGFVVHFAGTRPTADHLGRLLGTVPELTRALLGPR